MAVHPRDRPWQVLLYRVYKETETGDKGSFTIVNIYVFSTESTRGGGRGVRGQRTIFKMLINLWNILSKLMLLAGDELLRNY